MLKIGGITLETGLRLGRDLTLEGLEAEHDAVFLGMGLGGVNALRTEGETHANVRDAVDFIAELRQAPDLSKVPVGREVVVVGGGMTAVDAAVQSKLLGAEHVTIVYRRGRARMKASRVEQDHATDAGVRIVTNARPVNDPAAPAGHVAFDYVDDDQTPTGERFHLPADQVLVAIGQRLDDAPGGLAQEGGKIAVSGAGRTSLPGVWAGGDCAAGGEDLTVTAVAQGRDAAEDIHASLTR
jgi:dihydropyrimidine dehydrogenase (NAD+) subunit PreT